MPLLLPEYNSSQYGALRKGGKLFLEIIHDHKPEFTCIQSPSVIREL